VPQVLLQSLHQNAAKPFSELERVCTEACCCDFSVKERAPKGARINPERQFRGAEVWSQQEAELLLFLWD
jgi:hypothetical protein